MPALFGNQSLPADVLKADKKACKKIGPLGMGKRALYLNSFYISRRYYVVWTDIRRVYKQVAMSKGGFTGIGAFGSMSYLVVELRDGRIKRCQIKYEHQTDEAISWITEHHPEIPTKSAEAAKKLAAAEEARKARYRKKLSAEEEWEVRTLEEAQQYLEAKPLLYQELSYAAGKKRAQQRVSPGRRALGIGIMALSLILLAAGIPLALKGSAYGIYCILFGAAFLLFSMAGNLVPVGRNSPGKVEEEWQTAVSACEAYISVWHASAAPVCSESRPGNRGKTDKIDQGYRGGEFLTEESVTHQDCFPVPARYAHPVVLKRMARVIREGRAEERTQALEVVKADLKALNKSVTVSQQEYDEVVAVKAMFLVSDYQ